MHVYMYMCACVYIYIYIHIYTHTWLPFSQEWGVAGEQQQTVLSAG